MQWLSRSSAAAVVYVIGEQPDLVAQKSSRRRVLSHPHGRCRICRWRVQRSMTLVGKHMGCPPTLIATERGHAAPRARGYAEGTGAQLQCRHIYYQARDTRSMTDAPVPLTRYKRDI
jgi:hypothetical protein